MKNVFQGLVLLDRDGVINELVVDSEHGTVDSPLAAAQVRMIPRAAEAIVRLNQAGFGVAIVTNQPAAAKGKTTRAHLEAVHQAVLAHIHKAGGMILSSHICFHRAEDNCHCRKPKTALLDEAFQKNSGYAREASWMIGDGLADIQAGQSFGLKTILIAAHKTDTCQKVFANDLRPTHWADNLWDAADHILHVFSAQNRPSDH